MNTTQTRFITEDLYYHHRDKQDQDLRKEFVKQYDLIEGGNKKLRHEVSQVTDEINQVKDEVGQVRDTLGYVEARLDQMEGRSYNKSRFLPWHDIAKIGVYLPHVGIGFPNYFPTTIKDFWSLQFPRNRYKHWGKSLESFADNSDTDSFLSNESDPLQREQVLKDAIRNYPQRAVEELASRLGIVIENIHKFYVDATRFQGPPILGTKRSPKSVESDVKDSKQAKKSKIQPYSDILMYPLPQRAQLPKSPSSESTYTRLEWDVHANKQARELVMDKLKAAGSPTKEITSQESRERRIKWQESCQDQLDKES